MERCNKNASREGSGYLFEKAMVLFHVLRKNDTTDVIKSRKKKRKEKKKMFRLGGNNERNKNSGDCSLAEISVAGSLFILNIVHL